MCRVYIACIMVVVFWVQMALSYKPLLQTRLGPVQGLEADDGDYFMYLGIPYAKVNETNPFGESLPHPTFNETFDASNDNIMCPQKDEFNYTYVGTVDCLTINIYVPKQANSTNKLPVLVYVYGGYFIMGFNRRYIYGPKFLVRHDIVIAIFNYRVGPYGFLCLDIPEVPGNQGYKDQKKALKWVRDNIEDYGGDPNKITIDGHSFGAVSVDLILHSLDENERLFDKVILQSGNYLTQYPIIETSHARGVLKTAQYLGLNTSDVTEAIKFLSSANSSSVIEASLKAMIPYRYCVEKSFNNINKFMADYRWNMDVPAAKNISFMLGNTRNESFFLYGINIPEVVQLLDPIMLWSKNFNLTAEEKNEMTKIIHDFYEVNRTFNMKFQDKFIKYGNDVHYVHASRLNMLKYMENGARVAYYYIFSYEGQTNFMSDKLNLPTVGGATHGDEISYLFDVFYIKERSREDQLIIDRMTTLWANFVKYGNPTPYKTDLLPVTWLPYTREEQHYLDIDTKMSSESMKSNKAIPFWDLFFQFYGDKIKDYLN